MPQWITALSTPAIAVVVVGVSYAQMVISKRRFNLDLFDRRMRVYEALQDLMSAAVSRQVKPVEFAKFQNGTSSSVFLFPRRVQKLIEAARSNAERLNEVRAGQYEWGEGFEQKPTPNHDELVKEEHELTQWFESQIRDAKKCFAPEMRISGPARGLV